MTTHAYNPGCELRYQSHRDVGKKKEGGDKGRGETWQPPHAYAFRAGQGIHDDIGQYNRWQVMIGRVTMWRIKVRNNDDGCEEMSTGTL